MSGYSSFHCDIFSSAWKANLPTTHSYNGPNIAGGLAVEMVIPLEVGLDKSATQCLWVLVEQMSFWTSSQLQTTHIVLLDVI